MKWQNISKFGKTFLEDVMRNARKYPWRYEVRHYNTEGAGERRYEVALWKNGAEVKLVLVEDEDGGVRVEQINGDEWEVEKLLYSAMRGEIERALVVVR